jgi:Na+/H+ antiporter NhaD/arsenite permease-like protein
MLARNIVRLCKNTRISILALVYITFIGSMLIANDMALLTFLPLGTFVLTTTGKGKYMAFTFIMQNIAANLGGMLTPFGNPQNLYLYSKFNIDNLEFMKIMAPPFIFAITLITICCIVGVKPEPLSIKDEHSKLPPLRVALYLTLFALAIAIVFRGIPYWIGLIIIPLVLVFADRSALKKVDYPLLLTFVFFFVFAGNMARIDVVRNFFSFLLEKNTLLFSILSCQFISNVPSAILLSQFTENYKDLLVGVNIGGVGTLISSLASLITFREYTKRNPMMTGHYMKYFTLLNLFFLVALTGFMLVLNTI